MRGTTALALVAEPHLCCSVCLPARDWRPGDQVQDQLSDSIRESERVLAIMSDDDVAAGSVSERIATLT